MELAFKPQEKIVGTFIIGIALLLIATVVVIGRGKDWFQKYNDYHTVFPQSYNLQKNSAVKLFNTDIGKVKNITLEGNIVRVDLRIQEAFAPRLRHDSLATVKSPTLIGSEHISIKAGSAESRLIPEGGRIPSEPKRSLTDLLEEFEIETTAKKVIGTINDLAEVVQVLKDPQGPLFAALSNVNQTAADINRITRHIEAGQGTVGSVLMTRELIDDIQAKIAKLDPILDGVAQTTEVAPRFLDQLRDSLAFVGRLERRIDSIMQNIDKTVARGPRTLNLVQGNLRSLQKIETEVLGKMGDVQQILNGVKQMLTGFKVILANAQQGSRDIPAIAKTSKATLADLRDAIANLNKILKSLQKNILIRSHIPPEPEGLNIDAGLR